MKDQYFRLETSLMNNDRIYRLMEEMGMAGVGIHLALLVELRRREDYSCSLQSVVTLGRMWKVTPDEVLRVIRDFDLYKTEENEEGKVVFYSPYMDEVMEELDKKREQLSAGGRKRAMTAKRAANGRFASYSQLEEREEKETSTPLPPEGGIDADAAAVVDARNDVPVKSLTNPKPWQGYVDEALGERMWLEVQAMQTGLPFTTDGERIREVFVKHVLAQGQETTITSLRDAKSYLANFARRGTHTHKQLLEALKKSDEQRREQNPYRYEQRDEKTGRRSYCGITIPPHAPPRPHENAVWEKGGWGR